MALIDEVRSSLRVVSDMTDAEIDAYIEAAIAEMRRVGVSDELLHRESLDPLAKSAVIMYCKANYGFDSAMGITFWNWFNNTVTALKLSRADETIYETLVESGDVPDPSGGDAP